MEKRSDKFTITTKKNIGEIISGRYRIEKCLAERDRGSIYLVSDLQEGETRKVLKTISSAKVENAATDRLVKEFKTVRSIGHPGVTRCYEFDFDSTLGAYFVMEYLEWPTLEAIRPHLSQSNIIRILYELSSTLHSVHLHGILHLDLKPDNVFVDYNSLSDTPPSYDLIVKIADFGFAREISAEPNADIYGSYVYTSPERFGASKPDVRADVFSLGMIGLVLLTNQIPYTSDSSLPLLTQKKRYQPRLEQWSDEIPHSLAMLLTRSLHPSPSYRPASARDFATEIAPLLKRQISSIGYIPNPPFVGRTPEIKQLSSLLHEVAEGQHWAYLLLGDRGVGKSRLITEFVIQMQIRGHQCLKLDSDNISILQSGLSENLRRSLPDESAVVQPDLKFDEILERLSEIAKRKPLIIAWYGFDEASPKHQKALVKFFLESRNIQILWLIESSREPAVFASLGYTDKLVRRKLGELTQDSAIEMIDEMLAGAPGSRELAATLCQKVGRKPGWLLLALKEIVRAGKIEFRDAQWSIPDANLDDWREVLSQSWAFQPKGLSRDAIAFAEWLAVLDIPSRLDEVSQLMEISAPDLGKVVSELENRDISVVENGMIRIKHPIIQEQIYRTISPAHRLQVHKGVGRWLEYQFGDLPSVSNLLSVAGHYYKANIKSDFRRIIQQILKRVDNLDDLEVNPFLVREALESSEDDWTNDLRIKGYTLLAKLLTNNSQYREAAAIYMWMIQDSALRSLIDLPLTQLHLGQILIKSGELAEAKRYLQSASRTLETINPAAAVDAYCSLGLCSLRGGRTDDANSYAEKCQELISLNKSLHMHHHALIQSARLCGRVGNYDQAAEYYEMIAGQTPPQEQSAGHFHAHIGLINIDLRKGRLGLVSNRLDKLEKSLSVRLLQQFKWKIEYYRLIVCLLIGDRQSAYNLIDSHWTTIRLAASPRNQCHMLLNIICAGYYSGAYTRTLRYLRKAFMIASRSSHDEIIAILYVWALRLRTIAGKDSQKLEKVALEHFQKCQGTMGKSSSGFLMAEYYMTLSEYEKADQVLRESIDAFQDHGSGIPGIAIKSMQSLIDIKLNRRSAIRDSVVITGEETDGVEDFFSKGMSFYWQLLIAIHTGSHKVAEKHYQSAQKYFKKIGALYWIAITHEQYGRYLSVTIDPSRGNQMILEADNLLRNLALPTGRDNSPTVLDVASKQNVPLARSLPLKELAEVLELLNTTGNPDELTFRLLEIAIKGMQASRGLIYFKRESSGGLPRRAAIRIGREEEIHISRTVVDEVYKAGKPIFTDDAAHDIYLSSLQSVQLGNIRTIACFPIIAENEIEGVLYLDFGSDAKQLDDSQKYYLSTIGQLIGTMMTHDRLIHRLRTDVKTLRRTLDEQDGYDKIKGKSRAMQEVFGQLHLIKGYDIPVLILGESGTGKELVARTVHRDSLRSEAQFVTVNCAAFPEQLIESLLFGHVKGSFTGANSNHVGLFEQANGGTIFLDEVEETSWAMQGKLLRVLQDGEYYRLGESKPRRCNVRLITAGKPSLLNRVEAGTFRSDLFYRMKVSQITVPTLAQRSDDIPLLVEHFLAMFTAKYGKQIDGIDPKAMLALQHYSWPGNIRQLEHCIQQAVLASGTHGIIQFEHLPSEIYITKKKSDLTAGSLAEAVSKFETEQILNSLIANDWDRNRVCRQLHISLSSLRRKMKEYELEPSVNR